MSEKLIIPLVVLLNDNCALKYFWTIYRCSLSFLSFISLQLNYTVQ